MVKQILKVNFKYELSMKIQKLISKFWKGQTFNHALKVNFKWGLKILKQRLNVDFKYRLQITNTKTNSIYVFQKLIINNETLKKIAHTENNFKGRFQMRNS